MVFRGQKETLASMNKREMKKFEKLLVDERQRLSGSIRNIEEASRHNNARDASNDLLSYAEAGTDSFEMETALNIASSESDRINDIDDALQRIKDGNYGTCEGCESSIPKKRLEVFPSARFCVDCQEEFEKENAFG